MGLADRIRTQPAAQPVANKNDPMAVLYGQVAEHLHAVGTAIAADAENVKAGQRPIAIRRLRPNAIADIQRSGEEEETARIFGCAHGQFGRMHRQNFDAGMTESLFRLNGSVSLLEVIIGAIDQHDAEGDHARATMDETLSRCLNLVTNCIYARAYAQRGLHILAVTGGPVAARYEKALPQLITAARENARKYCQSWSSVVFDEGHFLATADAMPVPEMPMTVSHSLNRDPGRVINGMWLTTDMHDAMIQHLVRLQAGGR